MSKRDPTLAEIQEVAATTLAVVNALIDRDAVIAGGFARDTICGIPTKDIDIWFHPDQTYQQVRNKLTEKDGVMTEDAYNTEFYTPESVHEFDPWYAYSILAKTLRKGGMTVSKPQHITMYNEDAGITWCQNLTKVRVNGVSVDLICVTEPVGRDVQALFDQFDFGICMASMRGRQVIFDERFQKDIKNRTLTFYDTSRSDEDMDRVLNDHLPRLRKKFPTFTVKGLEKYDIE